MLKTSALKEACKESLIIMKRSIQSSYTMNSDLKEQELFVEAWTAQKSEYLVFSDYHRNDGFRRLQDVLDIIDRALIKLEKNKDLSPSEIYLQTIKSVSLVKQWSKILEASA
ncbi:MAG: hypothetical protein ACTSUO_05375 [Candidatus Thorarchaeota archaeon]